MSMINKKKGFTLIETILVTGIAVLLSLGVFVIYTRVNETSMAALEARNMISIIGATRSLVGGSNIIPVLDAPLLAKARIIYSSQLSGNNYISSLGKTVTFSSIFSSGFSHIRVSYNDMDSTYCAKLAVAFKNDVDLITVNGVVIYNSMPLTTLIVPLDVSNLATACAAGGASFDQSFNFRR